MNETKKLSTGKVWCFAVGQFGWSVLAALISSWLVNYYQPDLATQQAGQPIFIPQGLAILGVLTILGAITAFGRIFDAVTDPLIASLSDRCKSKDGRRIPFMRAAAIPFALSCIFTFWSPVRAESWGNAAFLFVMLMLFYLFMTMYCTPYNALIPELGSDQKTRMAISTSISFTYIAGMAMAYLAPVVWGALQGMGMERVRTKARFRALYDTANLYILMEGDLADDAEVKTFPLDGPCWNDECADVLLAILFWIAAILTVWSGAEYLVSYWKDIDPSK